MGHALPGQKMKVTMQLEDGTFYELDAISSELSQNVDMVEMHFVGTGDITTGIKKTMVVCVGCGSEWKEDDPYHPGTCANCGWGAGSTKREINV